MGGARVINMSAAVLAAVRTAEYWQVRDPQLADFLCTPEQRLRRVRILLILDQHAVCVEEAGIQSDGGPGVREGAA